MNINKLLIKINFLLTIYVGQDYTVISPMSEQYEVEKILSKRIRNGKPEYRIKWLNYPETECTWEPEGNLTTCREMLKRYNQGLSKPAETEKSAPKLKPAKPTLTKSPNFEDKGKSAGLKKKIRQEDSND